MLTGPLRGFLIFVVAILFFTVFMASIKIKQNPKETFQTINSNIDILSPEIKLKLPGELVSIDRNFFFQIKDNIKKIDKDGSIIWQKDLKNFDVIGAKGKSVLLYCDGTVKIIDDNMQEVFLKQDFLWEPEIRSIDDDLFLLSGKRGQTEYLTLIDRAGNIRFDKPVKSPAVYASCNVKGDYTVIAMLEDQLAGEIVLLDSSGKSIWRKSSKNIPLLVKMVDDEIIIVWDKRVSKLNLDGDIIWDKSFKNQVLKADVENMGNTALVVEDTTSNLSRQVLPRVIVLNPNGKQIFSYFVDDIPFDLKIVHDKLLVSCDIGIMVFSKDGDQNFLIGLKGKKDLREVSSSYIIVKQGQKSNIIKVCGRQQDELGRFDISNYVNKKCLTGICARFRDLCF